MAYPGKVPFSYKFLQTEIADISTGGPGYIAVPFQGEMIGYVGVRSAATTGSAGITVEKNGDAFAGAAAAWGAGDDALVVDHSPIPVKRGDVIEIISDGGSTNTSIGSFTAIFRE